jgi:glyoxalase family protein
MVHRIVSRVGSEEALAFWAERFAAEGVPHERAGDRLRFSDPEGLGHELAVRPDVDAPLSAAHPEVPAELALQGFDGVRAYTSHPRHSGMVLEELLGATALGDDTWELRGEARGGTIAYDAPPADPGRQSAGTVHHVAWGTTVAEHARWDERLREAGVSTSGIVDRHYFHSIYFREPSGVLFEIADDGPGFTVDGYTTEQLGTAIILPPQLEPHRERIEAILTPLPDPRAQGSPAR